MKKAILGKKLGMSQIFTADGRVIPVTVVEAGPCFVMQVKSKEKDGYEAIKVAFGDIKESLVNKPTMAQFKKAGLKPARYIKEFRLENVNEFAVGQEIKCDSFTEGDKVDVTGISKGHGYAGVIKRWGQGRTPTSHGGGPVHRHAGSMGSSTDPSRIMPGKRQAGHMGVDQITVQNLDVVKVDAELNLIAIRGAVPGPKGSIVYIKDTVKTQIVKQAGAGISLNPQKASARVNPQKASARTK